jgi:hypothetical protein
VGCSSSKGGAKTAVSVRTSISVQITPGADAVPSVAATPIPAAGQTAVAAGASDPLVPYTDPNGRFTAKLPQGWDLQQQGNGVLAVLPGDPVAATIGITCAPGMTGGQLIQQDQNIADALHTGSFDETQPEGTQVAGISAERFEWVAHLGKTTQEHVSVYFDGHGCGWRLLLTTYTGTEIGTLRPLFDAVAASLTFS